MAFPTRKNHRTDIPKNYDLEELSELYLKARAINDIDGMDFYEDKIDLAIIYGPHVKPELAKEDLTYFLDIAPVGSMAYEFIGECIIGSILYDIGDSNGYKNLNEIINFFFALKCLSDNQKNVISKAICDRQNDFEQIKMANADELIKISKGSS